MAARQAVLGRHDAGKKKRRALPTVEESTAVSVAAADAAAMPAGWKPSRFFEAWKKKVAETAGGQICWFTMGHYMILTPDDRRYIIDKISRITIASGVYRTDDFYEGVYASHNDYGAMQLYLAVFVDTFWKDFWAGY